MEEHLPLTKKHHTLITSVTIGLKTKERMLHAASNLAEDANEYVLQQIHNHLAKTLKKRIKTYFKPKRKYKVELGEMPTESHKPEALTTTYSLAAYAYLVNPEQANLQEVVHPEAFSIDFDDHEITTASHKVFQPIFDQQIMQIMPVLEPEDALKYFVRIE